MRSIFNQIVSLGCVTCISHFKEEKRLNLNGIFFQGSHSMFYSRLLLMSAVFIFLLISKGSCDFNMLKLNRNKKKRIYNKQMSRNTRLHTTVTCKLKCTQTTYFCVVQPEQQKNLISLSPWNGTLLIKYTRSVKAQNSSK